MVIFGVKDFSAEFSKFSKTFCIPFILLFALISTGHLIANMNFTSTYTWKYDAGTKKMIEDLGKEYNHEYGPVKAGKIHVGVRWFFEPSVYYYILSRKLNWLAVAAGTEFLNKNNDFFYFLGDEKDSLTEKNIKIRVMKSYFPSNTILAKHINNGSP
jgi:hypothetical protein